MNTQSHLIDTAVDRRQSLQKWILRIMALVALPVLPAVFAPHLTVEKLSWLVGFGQPPKTPLLAYLAAGGSFIYLALSAMLWMISRDVARYRPLVIFMAYVCLIGGPAYWWIDSCVGMPQWWMLMDALTCTVAGVGLLWVSVTGKPECRPNDELHPRSDHAGA